MSCHQKSEIFVPAVSVIGWEVGGVQPLKPSHPDRLSLSASHPPPTGTWANRQDRGAASRVQPQAWALTAPQWSEINAYPESPRSAVSLRTRSWLRHALVHVPTPDWQHNAYCRYRRSASNHSRKASCFSFASLRAMRLKEIAAWDRREAGTEKGDGAVRWEREGLEAAAVNRVAANSYLRSQGPQHWRHPEAFHSVSCHTICQ